MYLNVQGEGRISLILDNPVSTPTAELTSISRISVFAAPGTVTVAGVP